MADRIGEGGNDLPTKHAKRREKTSAARISFVSFVCFVGINLRIR
jgi:hypothetical protein